MATHQAPNASKRGPNRMLWLIVGIPLVSVMMGALTLFLAVGANDGLMDVEQKPLSKTSWKEAVDE